MSRRIAGIAALLAGLVVLALGPAAAPRAESAPWPGVFDGAWRLDVARSTFGSGKVPLARHDEITSRPPWLDVTSTTIRAADDTLTLSYRYRPGGVATNPVMGQDVRTIAAWDGRALSLSTSTKLFFLEVKVDERWSRSADGRTLVVERTSRLPTGPLRQRLVFARR